MAGKPKERKPGQGACFQRKDGRWVAVVPVGRGTRSGRERRFLYASSEKEAKKRLKDALDALDRGMAIPDPRLTVGEHLAGWLDYQRPPNTRPSTYMAYRSHVKIHLVPLRSIPLIRLQPNDIRRLLMRIQSGPRPPAPATVRHTLVVLRMALKQAVDDGLVLRNVALSVKPPDPDRTEAIVLDLGQVRSFIASIAEHRLRAAFVTALGTGVRQGELLGLRWADVDLDAGILVIKAALRPIPPEFRTENALRLQRVEPKTDNAYRAAPLPQFVVAELVRHQEEQKRSKLRNVEGLVFTTHLGTPLDGRNVTREFQAALKAAKLPRLRFHDIRHTTASMLRSMGVPIDDVKAILGHGSAGQTWAYTHVMPEVWARATSALDKAVG